MEDELFKKTVEVLINYKSIRATIENLKMDIEEIGEEYIGCRAIEYAEKTGATNKFNSSVENEALELEKERLQYELDKRIKLIERIDNALETLKEREYEIIKYKHFNGLKTWDLVGEKVGLTSDYCCSLGKEIITRLSKIIFAGKYLKNTEKI